MAHRHKQQLSAGKINLRSLVLSEAEFLAMGPIDGLLRNPVERSLKLGIKALGRRLNTLGGFDLMRATLESAAKADPDNYGRRLNAVEHPWSGIGTWVA